MSSLSINEIRPRSMFLLNFLSSREPISGPHPRRVGLLATFLSTRLPIPHHPLFSVSPLLPPSLYPLSLFFSHSACPPSLSHSLFFPSFFSFSLSAHFPLTSIPSPLFPPIFFPFPLLLSVSPFSSLSPLPLTLSLPSSLPPPSLSSHSFPPNSQPFPSSSFFLLSHLRSPVSPPSPTPMSFLSS